MHMFPQDIQLSNENQFARRNIDKYIRKEIAEDSDMPAYIAKGVELYTNWINKTYYESKQERLDQIRDLDPEEMVLECIVHTAYCQTPEPLTSIASALAKRLGFNDRKEGVLTATEILAVLCNTDLFDLIKPAASESWIIKSNLTFSDKLYSYIQQSLYLPPMVCEPRYIDSNRTGAYLTFNESVILKGFNHHEDDVCLDVINIQNKNAFSLDIEFLRSVDEQPPSDLDDVEDAHLKSRGEIKDIIQRKQENWKKFYGVSQRVYMLMYQQGNQFYFTNKVDKRGRMYTQGYHLNPQGSKHKKAMLNLAHEEHVTGVPT